MVALLVALKILPQLFVFRYQHESTDYDEDGQSGRLSAVLPVHTPHQVPAICATCTSIQVFVVAASLDRLDSGVQLQQICCFISRSAPHIRPDNPVGIRPDTGY
jgi:hypothetical protein